MIFASLRSKAIPAFLLALFLTGQAVAALPTVVINSSGSNTAASGAGPATALFGTAASTAASTTVTLLTDNPNLSGVATDGSAVLWVGSSSGRQFSKITGVNNTAGVKTVTVAVAYANTESGKNWGIGGKRATMAGSAQLFTDWALGWTVDVQTGETISAQIAIVAPTADQSTPQPIIKSSTYTTWGTQPIIQTATNSLIMFSGGGQPYKVYGLAFKSTAATPATCFQAIAEGTQQIWQDCIFDGFFMAIDGSNGAHWGFGAAVVDYCEIKNCTAIGSSFSAAVSLNPGTTHSSYVTNSHFHNNAQALYMNGGVVCIGNVFANNSNVKTVTMNGGTIPGCVLTHRNNTYYNNGASTVSSATDFVGYSDYVHENNIYYGQPGYAVSISGQGPNSIVNRNNAYGSSGAGQNFNNAFPAGENDITLTASPFVSTVTPDYGLNATAGGGAACKAVATGVPNASANTAGDLGAIPSGGGGSAGGGGFRPRPRTSFNLLPESHPTRSRILPAVSASEWRKAG